MLKLIALLGNPGSQYEQTRHNFAWLLAEGLAPAAFNQWQNKFKGLFLQSEINHRAIFFLKPSTFMNKSGESVLAAMNFFKFTPDQLLVVHDDIELDFGYIGFKKGGGLAGHNGLRSVVNLLNTTEFYRFRLGVSRPGFSNVSSYVLSRFSSEEQTMIPSLLKKAADIFLICLNEADEPAEQKFQKVKLI